MNSGRCVRGRRDGGRSVGPRAVSVRYRCGIGVTARVGRQSARADWDESSLCKSIFRNHMKCSHRIAVPRSPLTLRAAGESLHGNAAHAPSKRCDRPDVPLASDDERGCRDPHASGPLLFCRQHLQAGPESCDQGTRIGVGVTPFAHGCSRAVVIVRQPMR